MSMLSRAVVRQANTDGYRHARHRLDDRGRDAVDSNSLAIWQNDDRVAHRLYTVMICDGVG